MTAVRTVAYGAHEDQVADLRLPAGDGPHPVAVLLHGGFWRERYLRDGMEAAAEDLSQRGWATWNLEYRRVGGAGGWPATFDDVTAGIAALTRQPVDLDRLVILGHSAGGHLALWAASRVRAALVVSLGGVSDLEEAAALGLGDGAVEDLLGGSPAEVPERYAAASPPRLLPLGAPVLLVHGDADADVPVATARRFAALPGHGRCELRELPGVDHYAVVDPASPAWDATLTAVDPVLHR